MTVKLHLACVPDTEAVAGGSIRSLAALQVLCYVQGVCLSTFWVLTGDNPADRPSRVFRHRWLTRQQVFHKHTRDQDFSTSGSQDYSDSETILWGIVSESIQAIHSYTLHMGLFCVHEMDTGRARGVTIVLWKLVHGGELFSGKIERGGQILETWNMVFRKRVKRAMDVLQIHECGYPSHKVRRGVAAQIFTRTGLYDNTDQFGRWVSTKAMRLYVNEALHNATSMKSTPIANIALTTAIQEL